MKKTIAVRSSSEQPRAEDDRDASRSCPYAGPDHEPGDAGARDSAQHRGAHAEARIERAP